MPNDELWETLKRALGDCNCKWALATLEKLREQSAALTQERDEATHRVDLLLEANGKAGRQLTEFGEEINNRGARVAQLEGALRWALGEIDEFAERMPGQGPFWWRTELRRRADLSPAPAEPTPQPSTFGVHGKIRCHCGHVLLQDGECSGCSGRPDECGCEKSAVKHAILRPGLSASERQEVMAALRNLLKAWERRSESGSHLKHWLDAMDTIRPLYAKLYEKLTAEPAPQPEARSRFLRHLEIGPDGETRDVTPQPEALTPSERAEVVVALGRILEAAAYCTLTQVETALRFIAGESKALLAKLTAEATPDTPLTDAEVWAKMGAIKIRDEAEARRIEAQMAPWLAELERWKREERNAT